jgi:hypothetical protein
MTREEQQGYKVPGTVLIDEHGVGLNSQEDKASGQVFVQHDMQLLNSSSVRSSDVSGKDMLCSIGQQH